MISFASVFERIRQKPETVRVRYLFFSVGISFVFVVALWAFSLQASFGTLLKNDAGGAVDAVRENARNIQESAPVSLEDLLKAGKTLKEGVVEQSPSEATRPSSPETSDFLPGSAAAVTSGDATDTIDTAAGSAPVDVSPTKGSDTTPVAPTEHSAVDANQ
ncbi:MAG: hypothetical protein IPJ67_04485 [Candidatus Moraniibacteriota bacterium]|nr:MAG: hypothetical protein IPJ67_04485 [Candidatus Moranbacteria bacterium]